MKLSVKDFRIGNLIEYDNRIFSIYTIANEFPTLDTIEFGIGVIDWNNIKPIPLTEEWLLKFGFQKGSDGIFYIGGIFSIYQRHLNFGLIGGSLSWSEFKYVHQLQNIYHSLIGEELILNK